MDWADFFFLDDVNLDPSAQEKYLKQDFSREFSLLSKGLKAEEFDICSIEESFRSLVSQLGIETKVLIHPVRVALTGKTIGPGLFEVIYYLGRERTNERLRKFIKQ